MKLSHFLSACGTLIFFVGTAQADGPWTKIDVPLETYEVTVGDEVKQISPSCALSEYTGEHYSFYIKPGKADKMFIYFNGGGACWTGATCNPSSGVYVPTLAVANDPNVMGGLLDVENPDNPYKDWTIVFLSYCTGEVFLAAKDATYQNPNPTDDFPLPFFTIHHRGHDNFLYVMHYIRQNLLDPEKPLGKVAVTGSSAGSYGATLNFPWVKEMLGLADNPKAKAFLIGDGGAGVITGPFLDDALFGDNSSWHIDANLHQDLDSLVGVTTGTDLIPEAYRLNSGNNPKDKFAQYTTAYDAVQVFFWSLMPDSSGLDFADWNLAMDTITGGLSDELSNYRRYVYPGCDHTIFRFPEYYSSSLGGISFLDWLTGMTGEKNTDKNDWQNLSCTPGVDCGEDSLTQDGIGACFARTFGA